MDTAGALTPATRRRIGSKGVRICADLLEARPHGEAARGIVLIPTIRSQLRIWDFEHNHPMTNIANALKAEISRVARKEMKTEIVTLKKAVSTHRKEIAALKRRAHGIEQLVRGLNRGKASPAEPAGAEPSGVERFSGKGLAAHRKRLGLSAAEVGLLLGASAQSIYNWEQGSARPRSSYLPAIAALRKLGRRDAATVLAARVPRGTTGK